MREGGGGGRKGEKEGRGDDSEKEEEGRERERAGGREGGRKGGREGGREGGRKGGREEETAKRRVGGSERDRETAHSHLLIMKICPWSTPLCFTCCMNSLVHTHNPITLTCSSFGGNINEK